MANFKRGRGTPRKEGKRIDTKRVRAAEGQALNGGHSRAVGYDSWSSRPVEPPLLDEAARQPKKKGKKRPKRFQGCPGRPRKAHQFLTDTRTVERLRYSWLAREQVWETVEEEYRLCVHCPHEEVRSDYSGRWVKQGRRYLL